MTRFPTQMHALHGVGMLKLLYKHICVIKIKMSDFPWLPPMVSSVCYTDKSLFSQCIQLNVELQGQNTKTENKHNKIQLSNSSQSSIESCSEVQHTYSCREYSPSSMSAADPFCSMLTEPWSNTAPLVINLNNTSLVLQCFDGRCRLGGRKGIRPVKNWVVGCWHGYLSGARCRLAYGPADATATHCLLLQ